MNNHNLCKILDCCKPIRAKGLCSAHYQKLKKHGSPHAFKHFSHQDRLDFLNKAVRSKTNVCLIWPFTLGSHGYPEIQINGVRWLAHAYVLTETSGPRPSEKHDASHAPILCHNRACICPAHLRWATRSENQLDRFNDGTSNDGERNPAAKLTNIEALTIRSDPRCPKNIAQDFPVLETQIRRIKNGTRFKNV